MDTQRTSRAKYWVIVVLSLVALVLIVLYRPEAFWIPLPILFTAIALGFDWL